MPQLLANAQILELSGADACALAQAQFTSNVKSLSSGQWQWSAWLDPGGRVRNFFALFRARDERLLIWLPRGDAAAMATRLSTFVFRSRVSVRSLTGYSLLALSSKQFVAAENPADTWLLDFPGPTPRRAAIVDAAIVDATIGRPIDADRLAAWIREDIAAQLPWIDDEAAEEFTPQALGLERLNAISFDKGCYPGQEIVARLHYRGGNKRGCMRVRTESSEPIRAGERIEIDSIPATYGRILYAAPPHDGFSEALAVLPLSLSENAGMKLESGVIVGRFPFKGEVL